jgi:hypothetical protein
MRNRGDLATARSLLSQSLATLRDLGDKRGIALVLHNLGGVAQDDHDLAAAGIRYREALTLRRELGDGRGVAEDLEGLAASAAGHDVLAARLLGAASTLRETLGAPHSAADRARHARVVAALRAALGKAAYRAAWDEGRAWSLDEAVAAALDLIPAA